MKISLIVAAIPSVIFLLIPTISVMINPSGYDGNAIAIGLTAGFFVALFLFMVVFGLSMLILNKFRKNK